MRRSMTSADRKLLAVLLMLNAIAAGIYFILHLRRGKDKRALVNTIMFLVFPVVGEVFMLFANIMQRLLEHFKDMGISMQELSFSKQRMKLRLSGDVEKELNTVPIEEVLLVADKKDKRGALFDLLKGESYMGVIDQLHGAVENDDMEVAHYAATFITDAMAKFKNREAELRKGVEESATAEKLVEYTDYLAASLHPNIYSQQDLKRYTAYMDKAANLLYKQYPDSVKPTVITTLTELWQAAGEEENIAVWVERARSKISKHPEYFKLCARYYYLIEDRESLSALLAEIKLYTVPLDSESLEWIRTLRL